METELSAIDRDALQRCYDTVRAQGPEQAAHLDHIERTSGWRMAAELSLIHISEPTRQAALLRHGARARPRAGGAS